MTSLAQNIGVFDSGIGGLTVLRALKDRLDSESYVYIGDTARLPYGTKSRETVVRYTESIVRILLRQNLKALVIACNTASTHALDAVKVLAPHIPVIGMIDPAAEAALLATRNKKIAVIGTAGTVRSGAYEKKLKEHGDVQVMSQACQMLVSLAEEGWHSGVIANSILKEYLDPILKVSNPPDTLILGCTHFPVFEKSIRALYGPDITLINSGFEAAKVLADTIAPSQDKPDMRFFVTDGPDRFSAQAKLFFGAAVHQGSVSLIDIIDLTNPPR